MNERMRELNQLEEIADCISYYDTTETTAEEAVAYYETHETMPSWYNSHDRKLLIEKVASIIS